MSKFQNKEKSYSLVIVESPAKCKKIEDYLGPGYKCIASYGHIRELQSLDDIDIKNNFLTKYHLPADSKKRTHVDFLKKEIEKADEVILATDDDREGEAIAWHICSLFNLPIESTKRIIFHEITEKAIVDAVHNPTRLNMNVVFSQQARQILDLLVGFKITPLLWKFISQTKENSLSAGRCQTPALRIVYDNQQEINSSPGKKVYNTCGYFTNKIISFDLNKTFDTEQIITEFLEETVNHDHIFSRTEPAKVFKKSPEPFTTSRLQQVSSNELHISPKETMKHCQNLYEQGYITYMRTDSKKYCQEFVDSVKEYILRTYGADKYISVTINELLQGFQEDKTEKPFKTEKGTKKPVAQEAHEAIRPTNILTKEVSDEMHPREKKLYKLIWENSLASCMSPAEYYSITSSITAPLSAKYSTTSELNNFLGWKIVSLSPSEKKDISEAKEYTYLNQLKQGSILPYKKITAKITIKEKKLHYTEAKLVSLLEEQGIGRPSTFASLIDKIMERGYVKKEDVSGLSIACKDFDLEDDILTEMNSVREFGNEKGKLVIQPVGILVIEFLIKYFDEMFNYDYTSMMETELDKVLKGETIWQALCVDCLKNIETNSLKLVEEKKYEIKIDDSHFYIIGKHGPVIKCIDPNEKPDSKKKSTATFLSVKPDIDLKKLERGEYTLEQIILPPSSSEYLLGDYLGTQLILKKGRYGLYASWEQNTKTKSLPTLGNRPFENITMEEVTAILDLDDKTCGTNPLIPTQLRKITNELSIRSGKYGDYLFYKTEKMKKPQFLKLHGFKENHLECSLDSIKKWVKETYNV